MDPRRIHQISGIGGAAMIPITRYIHSRYNQKRQDDWQRGRGIIEKITDWYNGKTGPDKNFYQKAMPFIEGGSALLTARDLYKGFGPQRSKALTPAQALVKASKYSMMTKEAFLRKFLQNRNIMNARQKLFGGANRAQTMQRANAARTRGLEAMRPQQGPSAAAILSGGRPIQRWNINGAAALTDWLRGGKSMNAQQLQGMINKSRSLRNFHRPIPGQGMLGGGASRLPMRMPQQIPYGMAM